MKQKYYAVLGAKETEMDAIEEALSEAGIPYGYACTDDELRVDDHDAYHAKEIVGGLDRITPCTIAILIECDGEEIRNKLCDLTQGYIRINHHRTSDPGYGQHSYFSSSSIGRVLMLLAQKGYPVLEGHERRREPRGSEKGCLPGVVKYTTDGVYLKTSPWEWTQVPEGLLYIAAADRCMGSALRGECAGVDSDKFLDWLKTVNPNG